MLPRIQTFVWLCLHNSIEVKECLNLRGMLSDTQLHFCHTSSESIIHAFHDCGVVKHIWDQLGENWLNRSFSNKNIYEWLEENGTKQQIIGQHTIPWTMIFLFVIWLIWKHRNQVVFKELRPNTDLAKEISRSSWGILTMLAHLRKLLHVFVDLSDGINLKVDG